MRWYARWSRAMTVPINRTKYRSPNHDDRPPGTIIDSLVIHTTEGNWPSDIQWMCNKTSKVSCHYVISPDGLIYAIVDDSERAWHAGESSYAGRSDYNNFSLGIEVSHMQNQPYGQSMLPALTGLCQQLLKAYPIARTYVVMHRTVAPSRKIDMTNVSDAQFANWADSLYIPASRRYVIVAPSAVFTDRRPDSPLAGGMDSGQTQLQPGDVINVGQIQDGWLWVSDNEHNPPGIGFLPESYARPL
jgi:hypothetical protein